MNNPLFRPYPYQQEFIDRLREISPTARRIFDLPAIRSGISFNADRVDERTGPIPDLSLRNAANALEGADLSGLEHRMMRNAMFSIRYGKTWLRADRHETNVRMFFGGMVDHGDDDTQMVYLRKTLMYYHVQSALLSWSE